MSRLDDAAARLRAALPSPSPVEAVADRARDLRARRRVALAGLACAALVAVVGVGVLTIGRDTGQPTELGTAEQPETFPPEVSLPVEEIIGDGWEVHLDVEGGTWAVTAPGFNELVEQTRPDWAGLARDAAPVLLRVPADLKGVEIHKDTTVPQRPVVTVTMPSEDDSIAAVRYVLVFEYGDDGLARFVEGTASQRCQPGRGHRDFAPAPCL